MTNNGPATRPWLLAVRVSTNERRAIDRAAGALTPAEWAGWVLQDAAEVAKASGHQPPPVPPVAGTSPPLGGGKGRWRLAENDRRDGYIQAPLSEAAAELVRTAVKATGIREATWARRALMAAVYSV